MLISSQQWAAMGQERFASRLWAVLQRSLCYPGDRPAHFRGFVQRCIVSAEHYELRDELSQARFAYAAWMLGEDFHERVPALELLLSDGEITAHQKSSALIDFLKALFGKPAQE